MSWATSPSSRSGFLSTPSARRATSIAGTLQRSCNISIHALREEGDRQAQIAECRLGNFYPRPPRGGRQPFMYTRVFVHVFLSTPSARRATQGAVDIAQATPDFYPRPPRGGRRPKQQKQRRPKSISIHALREEGDQQFRPACPGA